MSSILDRNTGAVGGFTPRGTPVDPATQAMRSQEANAAARAQLQQQQAQAGMQQAQAGMQGNPMMAQYQQYQDPTGTPDAGLAQVNGMSQMDRARQAGNYQNTAGLMAGTTGVMGYGDAVDFSRSGDALQQAATYQYQTGGAGTGIDHQLQMIQGNYDRLRGIDEIGFDYQAQQAGATNVRGAELAQMQEQDTTRGTNLNQMASDLAQRYGLALPRGGSIVDENGTMLYTPDQIAQMSGGAETIGTAAAKMQYIENAITQEQNRKQQELARGAISAGMQLVSDRGRGSLATMQSGFYQDLADLYSNQIEEAEDFSYFIQKEAQDIQMELQARAERLFRKQSRMLAMMGIGNIIGGAVSGNTGMVAQGAGQTAAGGHGAGWW